MTLPENPAWPQVEAAVVDFARRIQSRPSDQGSAPGREAP